MKIWKMNFQYSFTGIDESMVQTAKDMITIGERWHLPMILSVRICGANGVSSKNHVLGLYKGMIIDGEWCHAWLFNEQNLHQACGDKARFYGVVRGYLMFPPKSRLSLDHTSSDDRNFLSSVYMKMNDNGDSLRMTKSYTMNKLLKKRKRRCWTKKGDARIKNKRRI